MSFYFPYRDTVLTRLFGGVVCIVLAIFLFIGREVYSRNLAGTPANSLTEPLLEGVSLLILSISGVLFAVGLYLFGRAYWLRSKGRRIIDLRSDP